MRVDLVLGIVGRVVVPEHDVALDAVDVLDEEVGDARAVRDEVRADALGLELVLAVRVRARGAAAVLGDGTPSGEESEHTCPEHVFYELQRGQQLERSERRAL